MLKIIREYDFKELQEMVWSGAIYTLEVIEEHGLEEELMIFLDNLSDEETLTDTFVNDVLWHDRDYVFEVLGIEEE